MVSNLLYGHDLFVTSMILKDAIRNKMYIVVHKVTLNNKASKTTKYYHDLTSTSIV